MHLEILVKPFYSHTVLPVCMWMCVHNQIHTHTHTYIVWTGTHTYVNIRGAPLVLFLGRCQAYFLEIGYIHWET